MELETSDYVLDAFGVVALMYDEPGGREVRSILSRVMNREAQIAMSVVNWGEVMYVVERRNGLADAHQVALALDSVPVEILPVGRELAESAARFKARGRISYADCYAAALAQLRGATLLTGDEEFRAFEQDVRIQWLPRRLDS